MRKLFLYGLLIFLVSCKQSIKTDQKNESEIASKYSGLLNKFQDFSVDTFQIYSSEDVEDVQYKFKGIPIDSLEIRLLPKEFGDLNNEDLGFFACYKFLIDSTTVGLIMRTPSEYMASSIKLFILDKQKDSITDYIELAEIIGDAGDVTDKRSWLFTKTNMPKIFMWSKESHDNSVDNEKDTTIQIWNYYYQMDISKKKIDTSNKRFIDLKKEYSHLIPKVD